MKPEPRFFEVRIAVKQEQVSALEALLEDLGAVAVSLRDFADDPVLEPAPGQTPLWRDVEVCGLFDNSTPQARVSSALALLPGVDPECGIEIEQVPEKDWVSAWQVDFAPMRFGRRLWIVPGHAEPPDPDGVVLHLDPGLAFGSGTHPSTRLCLEWIDSHHLDAQRVIDFGCGSGVLGIAAALKGAAQVLAVDIDPQALLATRENARRNGVDGVFKVFPVADLGGEQGDVVLANILSGTLIELADVLGRAVRDGGILVLAGILEAQASEVMGAYAAHFPAMERSLHDGWVCLAGVKRR